MLMGVIGGALPSPDALRTYLLSQGWRKRDIKEYARLILAYTIATQRLALVAAALAAVDQPPDAPSRVLLVLSGPPGDATVGDAYADALTGLVTVEDEILEFEEASFTSTATLAVARLYAVLTS